MVELPSTVFDYSRYEELPATPEHGLEVAGMASGLVDNATSAQFPLIRRPKETILCLPNPAAAAYEGQVTITDGESGEVSVVIGNYATETNAAGAITATETLRIGLDGAARVVRQIRRSGFSNAWERDSKPASANDLNRAATFLKPNTSAEYDQPEADYFNRLVVTFEDGSRFALSAQVPGTSHWLAIQVDENNVPLPYPFKDNTVNGVEFVDSKTVMTTSPDLKSENFLSKEEKHFSFGHEQSRIVYCDPANEKIISVYEPEAELHQSGALQLSDRERFALGLTADGAGPNLKQIAALAEAIIDRDKVMFDGSSKAHDLARVAARSATYALSSVGLLGFCEPAESLEQDPLYNQIVDALNDDDIWALFSATNQNYQDRAQTLGHLKEMYRHYPGLNKRTSCGIVADITEAMVRRYAESSL